MVLMPSSSIGRPKLLMNRAFPSGAPGTRTLLPSATHGGTNSPSVRLPVTRRVVAASFAGLVARSSSNGGRLRREKA